MKNEQKAFQLAPGYSAEEIEEIAGLVRWVGFREVKLVRRRVGYDTTCVIARK